MKNLIFLLTKKIKRIFWVFKHFSLILYFPQKAIVTISFSKISPQISFSIIAITSPLIYPYSYCFFIVPILKIFNLKLLNFVCHPLFFVYLISSCAVPLWPVSCLCIRLEFSAKFIKSFSSIIKQLICKQSSDISLIYGCRSSGKC